MGIEETEVAADEREGSGGRGEGVMVSILGRIIGTYLSNLIFQHISY